MRKLLIERLLHAVTMRAASNATRNILTRSIYAPPVSFVFVNHQSLTSSV